MIKNHTLCFHVVDLGALPADYFISGGIPSRSATHGASYCNVALQNPICNAHWREVPVKGDISAPQNINSTMLGYFVDKILRVFISTSGIERGKKKRKGILEERKRIDKKSIDENGDKQVVNYKSVKQRTKEKMDNWIDWRDGQYDVLA